MVGLLAPAVCWLFVAVLAACVWLPKAPVGADPEWWRPEPSR